jgi:hypothetical protein
MLTHSFCPYRGYDIRVWIEELKSPSFNGMQRRFTMCWSVEKHTSPAYAPSSFPEPSHFFSASEALRYAEARAHTYIDCTLANVDVLAE